MLHKHRVGCILIVIHYVPIFDKPYILLLNGNGSNVYAQIKRAPGGPPSLSRKMCEVGAPGVLFI